MKPEKQTKDSDKDRKTLGERLRDAREYVGFSQEEVAAFLGVPRSALSLVETGQRKVDALELKKLSELYKRPIGSFTGEGTEDSAYDMAVAHLARKVSELSNDDREELARFADFLRARKQGKES